MDKLNLETDTSMKTEVRRDVVDAPVSVVSERQRWAAAKERRRIFRWGKMGVFTLSCYCFAHFLTCSLCLDNSGPVIDYVPVGFSEI